MSNKKEFYFSLINNEEDFIGQSLTTQKIEMFLLFYINEKYSGRELFREAAQTRMKNIKNSIKYNPVIHKIHCVPLDTVDEIIDIAENYIKKYGDRDKAVVKEVGFFSHCGTDGPICYIKRVKRHPLTPEGYQMDLTGWGEIKFNWSNKARCVFYGCRSAVNPPNGGNPFADNISQLANFKNVEVWGQTNSSYPSFYPDYRVTSIYRSLNFGWDFPARNQTYMVAGAKNLKWKPVSFYKFSNKDLEELKDFPRAHPFNSYIFGIHKQTTHQGIFNDHRHKNNI